MFIGSGVTLSQCRREVRERVVKAYHCTALPLCRVVVAYPAVLENVRPLQVINDREMVLIIDGRNADLVFENCDLQLLRQVYNESRVRTEQRQPAIANAERKRAAEPPQSPPRRRSQRTRRRSEEHTSELQSLMRISSAVFCLKKNN